MGATSREKAAMRALKLLGEDRFTDIIRAIQEDSSITAVGLMNRELDAGTDLNAVFFTGDTYGFQLSAIKIEQCRFLIEFGFLAGPLAGDGGEWEVQFRTDGSISEVIPISRWIS